MTQAPVHQLTPAPVLWNTKAKYGKPTQDPMKAEYGKPTQDPMKAEYGKPTQDPMKAEW